MILNTQEWIELCLEKYQTETLPEDEWWEDAHHPIPQCFGGTEVVRLWSRDHSIHGVIQSEEMDHPCLHYSEGKDRSNIERFHSEYLPLLDKWLFKLRSLGGKITRDHKLGIFAIPEEQLSAFRMRGVTAQIEQKRGIFGRTSLEMKEQYEAGLGAISKEQKSANAKKAAAQSSKARFRNTHPDFEPHISTGAGLSHWQRSRGIDPTLRERVE